MKQNYELKGNCACGNVKYKVEGLENMEAVEAPFVALSKHQSTWETLFLQSLFWPSSTVLKKELLKIPFFGWGIRAMKPIPIDRSHPKEALKQVKLKFYNCLAIESMQTYFSRKKYIFKHTAEFF